MSAMAFNMAFKNDKMKKLTLNVRYLPTVVMRPRFYEKFTNPKKIFYRKCPI